MSGWLGVWLPGEWRRRWPGLLLLAVLLAAAGGVATALLAGARRADTSYARFLAATGSPNLFAPLSLSQVGIGEGTEGSPFDEQTIAELAAVPGVRSVVVESWWAIALTPELDPPGVVTAFAAGTFATAGDPGEPIVLDGRLPAVDDPDGVLINDEAERIFDLRVGETMTFRTASPARLQEWANNDAQFDSRSALDGPEITVRIAAVVRSQEDLDEDPFPTVDFPEGFARAHSDRIAHVEPEISFLVDPSRREAARAGLDAILARRGAGVLESPTLSDTVDPSIRVEVTTLQLTAIGASLAGALVIATALGRQASSIAADRATFAALGLTRAQRARATALYLLPVAVLGAAGVPLVAWGLSGLFPRGVARIAEPEPGLRFDGSSVLLGAGATAVVAAAVLAGSAFLSSRTTTVPATTRAGRVRGLGSPVQRLGASFAVDPSGTGGRSRVMAAATVGGIAIGVAAAISIATLDASRAALASTPRLYGAPAELVFESNGSFGMAAVVDATLATRGVEAVTRELLINDDSMEAIGPGGAAEVEPEAYEIRRGSALPPIVEGRYPLAPDEVALGQATADDLGAGVGDTISMVPLGTDDPLVLRVSGIAVKWELTDPRQAFIVTTGALERLLCAGVPFERCGFSVSVFADVANDDARAALHAAGFLDVAVPANVGRLDQVGAVPWYLAGFLCALGAVGLLHGVITSLRQRRRDVAVMRALGVTGARAADALVWQAILTTIAGVVSGGLVGAVVGPMIWRAIANDLGVIERPVVPALAVALVAVLGVLVAALLALGPRWRAAHTPLTVALRAE